MGLANVVMPGCVEDPACLAGLDCLGGWEREREREFMMRLKGYWRSRTDEMSRAAARWPDFAHLWRRLGDMYLLFLSPWLHIRTSLPVQRMASKLLGGI